MGDEFVLLLNTSQYSQFNASWPETCLKIWENLFRKLRNVIFPFPFHDASGPKIVQQSLYVHPRNFHDKQANKN